MGEVSAWMPLYIGDYLADTMHLNAQEHGAYLLMIMHYWRSGPLLDSDDFLAKISRTTPLEFKRKVRNAVLPFFSSENGRLTHKRVDQEMAVARANKDQKSQAGKASAAARALQRKSNERSTDVDTDVATAYPTESQRRVNPSPSPSPEEEKEGSLRDPKKAPQGCRLPDDWTPGERGKEFAVALGLEPQALFNEFRDYWMALPGQRGRKTDWDATWRNRCRDKAGGAGWKNGHSSHKKTVMEQWRERLGVEDVQQPVFDLEGEAL